MIQLTDALSNSLNIAKIFNKYSCICIVFSVKSVVLRGSLVSWQLLLYNSRIQFCTRFEKNGRTVASHISAALLAISSWHIIPDSKVYGANMGPTLRQQDPGGPHVGPMIFCYLGYSMENVSFGWSQVLFWWYIHGGLLYLLILINSLWPYDAI